jgi:hypothetical protein
MTEYVFKISTNDVGVVLETPDINPAHEDNLIEGIAYLSAVLVSIFINDISKHIKENQKDFIFTAQDMINNSAILKMGEKKMTQQFKFGDLVQHENKDFYPEIGVIVGMNTEHNEAKVHFEGFHHPEFVKANELVAVAQPETLEIIPHPDTVRLDWLLKNDCALTERLCDEDGDILETPNAVIQKQEDHFEVLAATSNDIREAIDEAMDSVGTR